jgi:hypothetical protein
MQPASTTARTATISVSMEILGVVNIKIGPIAYIGRIYNSWKLKIIFNANKTAQLYYNVIIQLM